MMERSAIIKALFLLFLLVVVPACGSCTMCNFAGSISGDVTQVNGNDNAVGNDQDDIDGETALLALLVLGALFVLAMVMGAASVTGIG